MKKKYLCISTNSINDSAFQNTNTECVKIKIYNNIYASSSQISNEHNIASPKFSILSECDWLSMLQKTQCNEYNSSHCLQIQVRKSYGYSIKL